jgi:hypothetical protein
VLQASERLTLAGSSETSATALDGAGGKIKLLGREVGLVDSARVDASGSSGGGEVLVGGGLQGKDPACRMREAVYFAPGASIAADATQAGDGGKIILWSDQATRAYGSLSARGGPNGGNGGFIETSGGWLDARPSKLDLSAPKARRDSGCSTRSTSRSTTRARYRLRRLFHGQCQRLDDLDRRHQGPARARHRRDHLDRRRGRCPGRRHHDEQCNAHREQFRPRQPDLIADGNIR